MGKRELAIFIPIFLSFSSGPADLGLQLRMHYGGSQLTFSLSTLVGSSKAAMRPPNVHCDAPLPELYDNIHLPYLSFPLL
jgi:hypothetical protein